MTFFGVILLLWLGTWQLHRLKWKEDLISLQARHSLLPVEDIHTIYSSSSIEKDNLEFRRVRAKGRFLTHLSLKLQGRTHEGKSGYHLIIPLVLENRLVVLVDRGWVPFAYSVIPVNPSKTFFIEGYLRFHSEKNFMTPANDYIKGDIYSVFPEEISSYFNLKELLLPFYIIQTESLSHESYPLPSKKSIFLRNFHFHYAITWYALALLLIIVYIVYRK
jgi:surfeit locus 1 family protein